MTDQTLPLRNDVPLEETWNLESIFSSPVEWEKAFQEVKSRLPELREYEGRLAKNARSLLECLRLREEILRLAGKVRVYSSLLSSVDTGDQEAAAMAGQGLGLLSRAMTSSAFIIPEVTAIGFDTLADWQKDHPDLQVYDQFFKNLARLKKHVRSGEVEEVLALATDPLPPNFPPASYTALTNAEIIFEPAESEDGRQIEIGQSNISSLITDPDREIRRTAWTHYADGYLNFKNTLAGIQTTAFKRDVFNARARRYSSSLEASLFPENIPSEVFHNLIEVFKANLPTWHRYWRIRRKALGYDKFHVYDIKAPLGGDKPHIPFRQAVDWISEGMAPLGEEYVSILRKGCLEERWVDRARNKGKRQGAFSSGVYDTQPFIMMSYGDDIFSLSTLAHELGHSLHSFYTRREQPFIYGRYSLFVAEVASNFNQALVRDYLFQTEQDPGLQLALAEEAMSNFHRYFFIMPTLARYELEMHRRAEEGEPINARVMIDLTADLFQEGYGDEVAFDRERIGITWAQFAHMYMNFYVFQYATGISGAHALADRVLGGEPGAADDYLEFLSAGSSKYALDALQDAGVDLTNPEPVEKAFQVLSETVDRLEEQVL